MKLLDPNSPIPLYVQLANVIRGQIEDGTLTYGDQLMPEIALSEHYGVGRITTRKAIELLVSEHALYRQQGKGTYVAYPDFDEKSCVQSRSFTAASIKSNERPSTRILGMEIVRVDEETRGRFYMMDEERLIRIVRIRHVEEKPVIYETDYLPLRYEPILKLDLNNRSLYGVMNSRFKVLITDFYDTFGLSLARGEVAAHLHVEEGYPLLQVSQTVFNGGREVVYFNEQLIIAESYDYTVKSFL